MNYSFRTDSEVAEIRERAAANLALMSRVYSKPRRPTAGSYGDIHRAIVAGDLEAVRLALSASTVNLPTIGALTPLHLAVFGYAKAAKSVQGQRLEAAGQKLVQEQIVELLLSAGADVAAWDQEKRLPAACCEGVKPPASLRRAMAQKIADTTDREATVHGFRANVFCTRGELLADMAV